MTIRQGLVLAAQTKEAGRNKEPFSHGTSRGRHFDFNSVNLILDPWPPELRDCIFISSHQLCDDLF